MDLSIVIPVYNSEKYISRCLDSIIRQKGCDYEIICVDDGSRDNSLQILKEYEGKYDHIHVYSQKHSFAGVARNTAIDHCCGEYIHFLDADDHIIEDSYEELVRYALDKDADYVKFRCRAYDLIMDTYVDKDYYSLSDIDGSRFGGLFDHYEWDGLLYVSTAPWTGLVKRQFLIDNGLRFNSLQCANDRSFYVEMLLKAKSMVLYDGFVVCHQINNKDSLVGMRAQRFDCQFASYELINEIVKRISAEYQSRILSEELRDMLSTYRRVLDSSFDGKLVDFLQKIDWTRIRDHVVLSENMRKPLELLNMKPSDIIEYRLPSLAALREYCLKKRRIVLYGAGVVGTSFVSYLAGEGILFSRIMCVAVTRKDRNPDAILGIPVCQASDIDFDEADAVIVATYEKIQREICYYLCGLARVEIRTLSDEVCEMLASG